MVSGGINNDARARAALVAGGIGNRASGELASVGGGFANSARALQARVGGGEYNDASGPKSAIAGGTSNVASALAAAVGGGRTNRATGTFATVSGGTLNTASGDYATIAGGESNIAGGDYSFAAGRRAGIDAGHDGAFVFADGLGFSFRSIRPNEFAVRASGGFRLYSSPDLSSGVVLEAGSGSWASASDRALKANLAPVDPRTVLDGVAGLPITTWNWRSQDQAVRHVGPTSQDFYRAFGLGRDDGRISTVDADGVALAAIQGLNQIVREQGERIARLEADLSALEGAGGRSGNPPSWGLVAIVALAAFSLGRWGRRGPLNRRAARASR